MPRNRRRRRHHRTHQVRPPSAPLPPFKIPVAGRSAPLPRLQNVGIHPQTHRASRFAPLESRIQENPVQPFLLRRPLHRLRSRHHHRAHLRAHMMSPRHPRRRPQILNPRIRARSDKHSVNADVLNPPPGSSPMYCNASSAARRSPSFMPPISGTRPVTGATIPGFVPHVTNGQSCAASISTTLSNAAPSSVGRLRQY